MIKHAGVFLLLIFIAGCSMDKNYFTEDGELLKEKLITHCSKENSRASKEEIRHYVDSLERECFTGPFTDFKDDKDGFPPCSQSFLAIKFTCDKTASSLAVQMDKYSKNK